MGLMIDGKWHDQWYDTESTQGRFERSVAAFRNKITETGDTGFKAEPDRYHLYVSLACPWAHRCLIFRKLKGLENLISISVVNPGMHEHGWTFEDDDGVIADPLFHSNYLWQIYKRAIDDFNGRVTVPVLWDKKTNQLVNNESSEIIRQFNSAFNQITGNDLDFYPKALQAEIDEINAFIYDDINNGVYKAGFATGQGPYEEAVTTLFKRLDWVEDRLSTHRYLLGKTLTEADWRLFTTLIRFDPVYVGHFKCNLRTISSYPNISGYLRELYQYSDVAETVNFDHIKRHYYDSHRMINPTGVIPRAQYRI